MPVIGGGRLSNADIFWTVGVFRCVRPHFLVQNNFGFFETYMYVRTDKGGRDWASSEILQTSEKGSIFSDFEGVLPSFV